MMAPCANLHERGSGLQEKFGGAELSCKSYLVREVHLVDVETKVGRTKKV